MSIAMIDKLIEKLINDFHERELPRVTPREVKIPEIPGKIDTIIGMRRAGKTSFLYQIMHEKIRKGLDKTRILYINFDDERLFSLTTPDLHIIPETYYRLFPDYKKQLCYFFFDEIQNVPGWEKFVRRLLDTENCHLFLTGSSAKLLSKEIATTLRGRAISTEMFPFSFREMLRHENPDFSFTKILGSHQRALLSNRFRKFLHHGGFPEVQTISDVYQIQILQEYVAIVILRDIIERHAISNSQALHTLTNYLLNTPAQLFSINKFYNDLKSQGITTSKNSLYDYLDYLHDAYLLFPVNISSRSERIRRTNPRKIYAIDTGLLNAFSHNIYSNEDYLLENFVYTQCRRKNLTLDYYRTNDNTEVDFLATSIQGKKTLYQVALELKNPHTREREIRALATAMKECHLNHSTIITLDHSETIVVDSGIINVMPVWEWAILPE